MASTASRTFDQGMMSWTKGVVKFFVQVNLGSSGAVSSVSGVGVASVTRTAAGRYVVVMTDTFYAGLNCDVRIERASTSAYGAGKATTFQLIGFTGNTGTFTIQGLNNVTDADADDSAVLWLEITYKNSSAF